MTRPSALSIADAPAPAAAVEIASNQVSAVALESRGGRRVVAAHALEPLPDAALVPSLTAHNVRDRAAVIAALKRVLDQIGRPRRIGVVLPDLVAKVSLVKFAQPPARQQDLDQLVRWQVRKAAPFPIEEAQVSYVPAARGADGQEFLVSVARRDVVAEYEGLCTAAAAHAGLVDISTFNVVNAVIAADGGRGAAQDWLLVNVAADYASIVVLRGADVILFRSRGAGAEGTLADLVHQTAMYYEDRLQGAGFGRVLLCGASSYAARHGDSAEQIRQALQERLGRTVETVDPRSAVALADRISATAIFLDGITPLVGMLLRDASGPAA